MYLPIIQKQSKIMNQSFALLIKIVFAGLDLLVLNLIYFVLGWYILKAPISVIEGEYLNFAMFLNGGWILCCSFYNFYNSRFVKQFESFILRTLHTYFLFLVITLVYLYFSRQLEISRIFASAVLIYFSLSLLVNRLLYLLIWRHLRKKKYLIKRVMIIGYNDIGKNLATYFERSNTQMQLIGFCEELNCVHELSHYPILNTPGNAITASRELKITEIYSTILPEQDKRIYDLMHMADQACIRFKLVPDFSLFVNRPMHLKYLSGMPVLSSRTEPLEDLTNRIKKRLLDILFSAFVIIFILSWLIPLIALAIWLDSRGPIFFIQKRSGINNNTFNCIKFRSMKVNADAHRLQAKRNDERFTCVGKFLRKTNLDEFPQFFNVFKGEMSIVGPRPHMLKHTEQYSAIINKYMVRQFVKPGITGWAQVNGYRGEIVVPEDMQVRVDHDVWYMENWFFFLDIKIICLTANSILKHDKNAF